jgi:hypothetical protein
MLYVATLALAKLSIISLLMILTASRTHRNMGIGLTAFIALWGIVTLLVAAFQCGSSAPWQSFGPGSRCIDMVWSYDLSSNGRLTTCIDRVLAGHRCH